MVATRLRSRRDLNRFCLRGGYLINIDPEENVIHTCECRWISKMDPQKSEGGIYYCRDYVEARRWLEKNHPRFKESSDCCKYLKTQVKSLREVSQIRKRNLRNILHM